MQYNSNTGNYEATLADGNKIVVDGDVYAEQLQSGVDPQELEQSSTWEACVDGDAVKIVGKTKIGYYDDEKEEWVETEVSTNLSDPDYPKD